MSALYAPKAMLVPPPLDPGFRPARIRPRLALLLNPFYPKDPRTSFGKHVLTPSLALTSVAAGTPPDWTVRFWDENLLQGPPPGDPFPQAVGITLHLTFARRAYALAAWYRERGARVILGGPHLHACGEEAAAHADAICIGDGVRAWSEFLRDVAKGTLRPRYEGSYRHPYQDEPSPRRDLVPVDAYCTTLSLIATRGCRNRCGFCYLSTRGLDMPYQQREVGAAVAEIEASVEPYAVFIDNNLGADPAYLRTLCRALRPLRRIWSAAVTLDVANDPALVREMALAGCTSVFIGFESLVDENLDAAGKRAPRAADYGRLVAVFHASGVQVNGSFVFGFDHDRPDVFRRTVEWIERNRLACATFHILTPYPGTPLFRQMEREGRLLHRDWDLYDTGHAVFRPWHMTPAQLEEGYAWSYRRLFSFRSIWARRPAGWIDLPAYLAMTVLYKRSNRVWRWLIRRRLTHAVWAPFLRLMRRRHLRFREALGRDAAGAPMPAWPAGV